MDRSKLNTLALVRLAQSVERWQARHPWQGADDREEAVPAGPIHTRDLLCLLPGDWREKRVEDLLPVQYSQGPEWNTAPDAAPDPAAEVPAPDEWDELVSGEKRRTWDTSGKAKLLIHLARIRGETAYFMAFLQDAGAEIARPSVLGAISISRSGMSFPTRRAHDPGEEMLIVCFLPQASESLPLLLPAGVVRPSRPLMHGWYQTPVRFVDLSEETGEHLRDYVALRLRRRSLSRAYHLDL